MNQLTDKYGTAERQAELLAMMKQIDALFESRGIRYSLCGGSLLGAVRENGFIPWDDDIDIMCDRDNYNKILMLFGNLKNSKCPYELRRHLWIDRIQRKDDHREALTAATIDIFVMDHCPDHVLFRKLKVLVLRMLQGMMKEKPRKEQHTRMMLVLLWVTFIIGLPFSDNRKFSWYHRVSQWGNSRKTKYITGYNDFFNLLTLRYSGRLMDSFDKHIFEDTEFPITCEYDNYLTTQYGDYMTPPPEQERTAIHIT